MKNYLFTCLLFLASTSGAAPLETCIIPMIYEEVLYRGAGGTIQKLVLHPTSVPQKQFDDTSSIQVKIADSSQPVLLSQLMGSIVISLRGYDFSQGIPEQLDKFLKSEKLEIIELILDSKSLVATNEYRCKRLIKK